MSLISNLYGRSRSRKRPVARRLAAPVAAAIAAAVGLAVAVRLRSARRDEAGAPSSSVAPDDPAGEVVDREWKCDCGETYRVSGEGRHRVYWRGDATVSDPVMSGACVSCDRPLPTQ
jgi:hypothetical protein